MCPYSVIVLLGQASLAHSLVSKGLRLQLSVEHLLVRRFVPIPQVIEQMSHCPQDDQT